MVDKMNIEEKKQNILKDCEYFLNKVIEDVKLKNNFYTLDKFKRTKDIGKIKGIYFFIQNENIVYIGQGVKLRERILQELRLYRKTSKGNNGGTLSKNIQSEENQTFDEQKDYEKFIKLWKLYIIDINTFKINIDILESLLIELYVPKYNLKGK